MSATMNAILWTDLARGKCPQQMTKRCQHYCRPLVRTQWEVVRWSSWILWWGVLGPFALEMYAQVLQQ